MREERQTESQEPSKKKARISSYPKLLFDKLWEMSLDSVSAVSKHLFLFDKKKIIIENNKNPNVNKNNLKNPQNWLHVFQCFYNLKNKDKRKKFNTPFRYRHY